MGLTLINSYSQFDTGERFLASGFKFIRRSGIDVSGTLTVAGSVTVTVTDIPRGINGSDQNHYLYISGGTGTPEPVLITGGTAVSEGNSGTLTFTTIYSHTGSWILTSATSGGAEALQYAIDKGAERYISYPPGIHSVYAPIHGNGNSNITISGVKGQTIIDLRLPSGFTASSASQWTPELTIGDGYFFLNFGSLGTETTVPANVNFPVDSRDGNSTMTVTVSSVPGDWSIGDYIGMQYQGWGNMNGSGPPTVPGGQQEFYQIAQISSIVGSDILFEELIVIPLAAAEVSGIPGHNQSKLTKLNLISENVVRDIIIDGENSSGSYGGAAIFFSRDCSYLNCEIRNTNNGGLVFGKGFRNSVISPRTFNSGGFSDVWCVGNTHLQVQDYKSIKPNFGLGIWWCTHFDIVGVTSIASRGRGIKIHGGAWGNLANGRTIAPAMTGFGVQGGSFNCNFSNLIAVASGQVQTGVSVGIYLSGEGNIRNKFTNCKALGNSGPTGIADMVIGAAFGFTDDNNSFINLEAPGGWADGSNGTYVLLATTPACAVTNSSAQTITNNTLTALTFDQDQFDYADTHSTTVNPERFVVPNSSQGIYEISGQVEFAANSTGLRRIEVWRNGLSGGLVAAVSVPAMASGNTIVPIPSGAQAQSFGTDYLTVYVLQDSGGDLNTVNGAGHTSINFRRIR